MTIRFGRHLKMHPPFVTHPLSITHQLMIGQNGIQLTVESFVGGKVKSIRVMGFRRLQAKTIPLPTPLEIQQEVRQVWLGRFCYAYCQIRWAEGEMWSFKAIIDS